MLVQLTDAGAALMAVATAPIVLTSYQLGTAYGYVPATDQGSVQGSLLYAGTPAAPVVENANVIKYSVSLADNLGPLSFGEIMLYKDATPFAVCVLDALIDKIPLDPNTRTGGALVIDVYLPMIGGNYEMWANTAQSNTLKISTVMGPEALPQPINAVPNLYVVQSPNSNAEAFLAFTDRAGKWNFTSYALIGNVSLAAADMRTISIPESQVSGLTVPYMGSLMMQFTQGRQFGTVRYITAIESDGSGNSLMTLNAPLAAIPSLSDAVEITGKLAAVSTTTPATDVTLGLVKIGPSMVASIDGTLNTNQATILTDMDGNVLGALVVQQ